MNGNNAYVVRFETGKYKYTNVVMTPKTGDRNAEINLAVEHVRNNVPDFIRVTSVTGPVTVHVAY
jgi:hypothetical protein